MTLGQHCDEIIRLIDEALAGAVPVRPLPATVRVVRGADEPRPGAADRLVPPRVRP